MGKGLPIIYVRGFAGGPSRINEQTEDPFHGFRLTVQGRAGAGAGADGLDG